MAGNDAWPALPYEEWAPTKKTLQLCAQMLGKTRLSLCPPQPEWLHTCLYLDARGFTTGPMPLLARVVTVDLDVFDASIRVRASDGAQAAVPIGPGRCVGEVWAELQAAYRSMGIEVDLWDKPQEVADTTPLSEDRSDCTFVAEHAQAYHRLLCTLDGVFEEFRSGFFGRSSIQFWWGACDFAVLLFTGRREVAPDDRGYIMRYDLDVQHMNAGFWPGDDRAPVPGFYSYLVPRPDGCENAEIAPEHAAWVEAMGEWMMPYESVHSCDDPRRAVLDFLESVYAVATGIGGWDADAFSYTKPVTPARA